MSSPLRVARLLHWSKGHSGPLGVAVLVAIAGAIAYGHYFRPEIGPAMRGEEVANKLGCFSCHGPEGVSGIRNPGSAARDVPGWEHRKISMYIRKEEDLREWILYGRPRNSLMAADRMETPGLVRMPAYEKIISTGELDDLVQYLRAVSGWAADIPDIVYEGRKIAADLGCFGCHGQSGMGGMSNPGSLKGTIPAWDGGDFKQVVRDEAELKEWILEGEIKRLWKNPLAWYFLKRQIIKMPPYREHISDLELQKIVAYIGWLRKE
ncbi:MAG: hypothetical protein A3G75_10765 [Verrucomicrobia bacterium RIFCSPLOWO2_12_FULL_64_8]|nr:MAG: hypothetical protein A3G75_10765 [Verrucomicrobia bacterium RIFCSPLOWO2_12_FULL_64_8]